MMEKEDHGRNVLERPFRPISDLRENDFPCQIKARAVRKSRIRTWDKPHSKGRYFVFDLYDGSGQIRVVTFNVEADEFFPRIEENQAYIFRNFSISLANRHYNNLNHPLEIHLGPITEIEHVNDDESVPYLPYEFQDFVTIQNAQPDTEIDLIGLATSASDVEYLESLKPQPNYVRKVTLVDESMRKVVLKLWGRQATEFSAANHPVVAVKGGKVKKFNNETEVLAIEGYSTLRLNPDIPEAHQLRSQHAAQQSV